MKFDENEKGKLQTKDFPITVKRINLEKAKDLSQAFILQHTITDGLPICFFDKLNQTI